MSKHSGLTRRISDSLSSFANELLREFDLSKETAQRLSRGCSRFKAHSILGKDGMAKVGGLKRRRLCQIDSYVSYRLRDDLISLNVWLGNEKSEQDLEYQVIGPKRLLSHPLDMRQLRPNVPIDPDAVLWGYGNRYATFEEAKAAFRDLLRSIGAPKAQQTP